jgi:hypothetical protein
MTDRCGLAATTVFLTLLLGVGPLMAGNSAGSAGFTYSEGWDVVSAPPPPGPYRAVNLDPRIPGQSMVPLLPVEGQPANAVSEKPVTEIPAEALNNPPAAGAPARSHAPAAPAARLNIEQAALPPPVPGRYNRMMPAPPASNYPVPSRSPMQSGYPGYRNTPPMGYYGAPVRRPAQQVPPPPVYDAMMNDRQSYGNPNAPGAP